jgi:hypothetical protein
MLDIDNGYEAKRRLTVMVVRWDVVWGSSVVL